MIFAIIAVFVFSCNEAQEKNKVTEPENTSTETVSPQQRKISDKNMLVGEWTRTDASYQIKITELLDDGNVKTRYFNPKSINTGNEPWTNEDGVLKIFIELRDEIYAGSKYDLTYIPGKGLLAATYFQAI